ncbi:hypothetical protein RR48_01929 [Papilio machaon]|uniref:Uncharacterized protein n=1 Tax=Papilio machaon TaxID=76193 RepID=A0A0N0PDF9_PAPMA|nr:hypothetical protein RR48_01929 [Papilio machaon]
MEKTVPVYKVDINTNEFVESQEFNEDNYLEMSNSFSTDNQTIIENNNKETTDIDRQEVDKKDLPNIKEIETNTDKIDSNSEVPEEGEYHSFHDEMDFEEAVYDSPVKKLVEKDIRDYSVPINFFCSDYGRNEVPTYQSPRKCDVQRILEPILEESKSINSDESNNFSCIEQVKIDLNVPKLDKKEETEDIDSNKCLQQEIYEISDKNEAKIKPENLTEENIFRMPNKVIAKDAKIKMQVTDSVRLSYSSIASSEGLSFDSTIEFEKLEIISDIIGIIINRIDFDNIYPNINEVNNNNNDLEITNINKNEISINEQQTFETFSIMDIVKEIERNESFNSTNDSNMQSESHRIVEAIIYYIYDRSFYIASQKNKRKQVKRVITVVDNEDILYTTSPLFLFIEDITAKINLESDCSSNKGDVCDKDINETNKFEPKVVYNKEEFNDNGMKKDSINVLDNKKTTEENIKVPSHIQYNSMVTNNDSIQVRCNDTILENKEIDNPSSIIDNIEVISDKTYVIKQEEEEVEDPLNDTFILDTENEMNTAFLANEFSRSSSPRRWNSVFDLCTESPIKNTGDLSGSDLSLLYERNNTLLGSPFVKQAPVIAMSQTQNRGGLKYWISFDDSLNDVQERCCSKTKKFPDNKMPSFYSLDFNKDGKGEHTVNGDHSDAHQSTFSHSSKEGSPSKEISTEDSPKKDKKKKKGLRTPSFLKKKKEKKKEKSSTPQPA